jgi:integrase
VVEHGKGKRRKVGYSNRSIKDVATLVKEILNEAVLLQYISENPAEKIKVPHKIENIEQKAYIGADEVAVFLAAIKGHRLEIPFIFGLYYGLRREEIVGLRWSALHDDGKLYIEHTVSRVKTTVAKDRVKTEASYRYYPVSTPLLKKLEKLRKEQIMNQARLGAEYIVSDYIFTWEDGRRYSPDYLTKSFKKVVRSNPLLDDSLTLHSLRASCVSILIHGGTDIKDVQEWVGHKDIQTTLNIYARTNEKQKNKVNQKMLSTMFEAV